jgi:hypothetical protein
VDQTAGEGIHRRAAVPLDAIAHDPQGPQLLHERPRELRPLPIPVDVRQDVAVDELAGPDEVVLLLRGERFSQPVVVGAQRLTDALHQFFHVRLLRRAVRLDPVRVGPAAPPTQTRNLRALCRSSSS